MGSLATAARQFEAFLHSHGLPLRPDRVAGTSISARARALSQCCSRWAVFLGETGKVQGSTISKYVTAVHSALCIDSDLPPGLGTRLEGVLKFYGMARSSSGRERKPAIPLQGLAQCLDRPETSPVARARQAAIALTLAGGLRAGEIVAAKSGDRERGLRRGHADLVLTDGDSAIASLDVHLTFNKSGGPRKVTIAAVTPIRISAGGATGHRFCGLRRFINWLVRDRGLRSARSIKDWLAAPTPGTLPHVFCSRGPGRVSPTGIADHLRAQVECPSRITGHCIRVTAVTTLAREGVEESIIRRFGGWKSEDSQDTYAIHNYFNLPRLPLPAWVDLRRPQQVIAASLEAARQLST